MYIKYSKQASTNLGKKNIWRVTSPGTRRYYNLSVICVYTYTIHFSLVISIHFKLYGTCWSHICTDATMKRSIAFRTVPQLTLSGPGPRSPFAHSWRSGKRYCVLSTPPKVNICSHSSTSLVHYPATSEYNYRDRSIFGSLEGPFMWGACAHESKLFESILLGGPTNWLGQHNPTNIKWAEHHQRPDNQRFQKNASFVCKSSKNGDTPSDRYIRTRPKKRPRDFLMRISTHLPTSDARPPGCIATYHSGVTIPCLAS